MKKINLGMNPFKLYSEQNWFIKFFMISLLLIIFPTLVGWEGNIAIAELGKILLGISFILLIKKQEWDIVIHFLKSFINKQFFLFCYITFSILWGWFVINSYFSLEYKVMDTGSFANVVTNYVVRGIYYNTYLESSGLTDHFTPNLILFSPLFRLFPSFIWLEVSRIIGFLICPFLLYKIGKEVLGEDSKWIYLVPCFWFFHEYLNTILFFSFQPSTLALPFILGSFLYAIRKQYLRMLIPLVFILGFKENTPLVWLSIGSFIVLIQKKRFLGGSIFVMGIFLGLFIFLYVMPHFNSGEPVPHSDLFGLFSLWDRKGLLIAYSLMSVGLLPLFDYRTLLFILPAFGLAFVSNSDNMLSFIYHYQDIPLSILMVGSIFGYCS